MNSHYTHSYPKNIQNSKTSQNIKALFVQEPRSHEAGDDKEAPQTVPESFCKAQCKTCEATWVPFPLYKAWWFTRLVRRSRFVIKCSIYKAFCKAVFDCWTRMQPQQFSKSGLAASFCFRYAFKEARVLGKHSEMTWGDLGCQPKQWNNMKQMWNCIHMSSPNSSKLICEAWTFYNKYKILLLYFFSRLARVSTIRSQLRSHSFQHTRVCPGDHDTDTHRR